MNSIIVTNSLRRILKYCCRTNSSHILWIIRQSLRTCKVVSISHLKQYGFPPKLRDNFNSLVNSHLWAASQRKVLIHWRPFHFQIVDYVLSDSWLSAPLITLHLDLTKKDQHLVPSHKRVSSSSEAKGGLTPLLRKIISANMIPLKIRKFQFPFNTYFSVHLVGDSWVPTIL